MIIKSFIFTGIVCVIAQIIKDNTKLTSGHMFLLELYSDFWEFMINL